MMQRERGRSDGVVAVEMALLLPLLLMIVFGIIEFGFAFHRSQGMEAAAREAARLASVGGAVSEIESRAHAALPPLVAASDVDVYVCRYQGGSYTTTEQCNSTTSIEAAGGTRVTSGVACDGAAADPHEIVRVDAIVERNLGHYQVNIPFVSRWTPDYRAMGVFQCEQ